MKYCQNVASRAPDHVFLDHGHRLLQKKGTVVKQLYCSSLLQYNQRSAKSPAEMVQKVFDAEAVTAQLAPRLKVVETVQAVGVVICT